MIQIPLRGHNILILFLVFLFSEAGAQEEIDRKGQFYLAPDVGLMLGTTTRIELSPMLGYYLTNRFTLAAGLRYEYYNYSKKYYGIYGFETSIYGPRLQARYVVVRNTDNIIPLRLNMAIFAQVEQEILNLEHRYFGLPSTMDEGRFWQPFTLAGAGFSQQAGRNSYIHFSVLWDLENSINSPYTNPTLRIGFQFGIGNKERRGKARDVVF